MIGIRCIPKIGLMALITVRIHQLIIAVGVARLTRNCHVCTGQRKLRRCVVERGRRPGCRRVALIARLGKIACNVVGICRVLEICLMALKAARICQLIVAIDVTVDARNSDVCAGQRKLRRRVVECGRRPPVHAMAKKAIRRKI